MMLSIVSLIALLAFALFCFMKHFREVNKRRLSGPKGRNRFRKK